MAGNQELLGSIRQERMAAGASVAGGTPRQKRAAIPRTPKSMERGPCAVRINTLTPASATAQITQRHENEKDFRPPTIPPFAAWSGCLRSLA